MDALHIQALITMIEVQSSQIGSIGHHAPTLTLAVRFKAKNGRGSLYHYANVKPETFGELSGAASVGAYLGAHIKGRSDLYPCTKIIEPAEDAPGASA